MNEYLCHASDGTNQAWFYVQAASIGAALTAAQAEVGVGVGVVNGQPLRVTIRVLALTQASTAGSTELTNLATLLSDAVTALTNNQTYLAIASPSQAQAVAQVAALTRQVDAIGRIVAQQLASTSGT